MLFRSPAEYRILSWTHGRYWPFPINLNTFEQFIGRAKSEMGFVREARTLLDANGFKPWPSAASKADVVITMLGFPSDVEASYLGADGIVARAKPGALLIDTSPQPQAAAQCGINCVQRTQLLRCGKPGNAVGFGNGQCAEDRAVRRQQRRDRNRRPCGVVDRCWRTDDQLRCALAGARCLRN